MSPNVVIALVGVLVILPLLSIVVMYNRFARQRTLVESSWSGVDVELARRHELIPNLVETVKGYAAHEREVLESLIAAREAATLHQKDAPHDREVYEEKVGSALSNVLVRAEAYPDLKASENFLKLQEALTLTEDRIAASRRFYNNNVQAYMTRLRTFPSNLVGKIFGFQPVQLFQLRDLAAREVPQL